VIVHEVPYRLVDTEGVEPNLSDAAPPLNAELKNYFRERIRGSLRRAAFDVLFDANSTSPMPELVGALLAGSQRLVSRSKKMAQHLNAVQTGANSGGLLVVATGSLEGTASVAVLKLEKEQGVRVREATVSGKHTLSLQHIRELMLTERTRVFKAGLFWQDGDVVVGLVSDNQIPGSAVADFFLRKFLGCTLRMAPDVITRRFVDATESFINDDVLDPSRKARYQIALLSEVSRAVDRVQPRNFAIEHLEVEDQDRYLDALRNWEIPIRAFPKNLELVKSRIQKMRLDFESGLILLAPPEVAEDKLKIESRPDGRTRVEFEDELKGISGRR
jgi:hypothetical protein